MSFDALYYNRRTRDVLEDYDLELYADPNGYPGPTNDPNSLFLGYDYFGYTENPGSNFVIGTLAGGKRDFNGLEFVFRKRFADRWQLLSSYNWNDAKGNTNSDSNADFQGDVDYLDPRAPNQFGTQPGLIRHLAKGAASYTFDFGLQLGGTFSWNSGTVASRTFLASQRNLPVRVSAADAFSVRRLHQSLARAGLGGLAHQPDLGQGRFASAVHPQDLGRCFRGVLRRPVQHHEQPVGDPQPGSGGWLGRQRVRQRDPLGRAATRVLRRSREILSEGLRSSRT